MFLWNCVTQAGSAFVLGLVLGLSKKNCSPTGPRAPPSI
ncbi:hypothetical protein BN844_5471 [Pseudomonas sp. SHC52]|nr:hypothetical protein BN844_5471 [Pseudomonas sp. SHC52]